MTRDTLRRALWLAMALDVILLAATGAGLTLNYRPEATLSRPSGALVGLEPSGGLLGDIHRWLAVGAVLLLAALVVVAVLTARTRPPTQAIVAALLLVAGGAIAVAWVSGADLPWTQLAVSTATPPSDVLRGVWPAAFDPLVTFVVVGGDEVGQAEYRTRVLTHLFAAPVVVVVALGTARFRSRRRA